MLDTRFETCDYDTAIRLVTTHRTLNIAGLITSSDDKLLVNMKVKDFGTYPLIPNTDLRRSTNPWRRIINEGLFSDLLDTQEVPDIDFLGGWFVNGRGLYLPFAFDYEQTHEELPVGSGLPYRWHSIDDLYATLPEFSVDINVGPRSIDALAFYLNQTSVR